MLKNLIVSLITVCIAASFSTASFSQDDAVDKSPKYWSECDVQRMLDKSEYKEFGAIHVWRRHATSMICNDKDEYVRATDKEQLVDLLRSHSNALGRLSESNRQQFDEYCKLFAEANTSEKMINKVLQSGALVRNTELMFVKRISGDSKFFMECFADAPAPARGWGL